MIEVRISPDSLPPWGAALVAMLAALVTRSVAMGVLAGKPVTRLDAAVVKRLATALQRHGIGSNAGVLLAPLAVEPARAIDLATQRRLEEGLSRLSEALEASKATGSSPRASASIAHVLDEPVDLLELGTKHLRWFGCRTE